MDVTLKTDQDLVSDLKNLRAKEKEVVWTILTYLREVEKRKLFLRKGFSSLFSFCTDSLGYSKDEAFMRIQAMRLMKSVPAVEEQVKSGALSLSNAARVQTSFRRAEKEGCLTDAKKEDVIKEVQNQSSRNCEKILATHFPTLEPKVDKAKPLTAKTTLIQFTADQQLVDKLDRLKVLLAHKNYESSMAKLISELADLALKKLEPKPPKSESIKISKENKSAAEALAPSPSELQLQPKAPAEASPEATSNKQLQFVVAQRGARRYISVHTRRKVFARAGGHCEYTDPQTRRRCNSNHALEIDHVKPLALGGRDAIENLRILCSQHNQFMAWQTFGPIPTPQSHTSMQSPHHT